MGPTAVRFICLPVALGAPHRRTTESSRKIDAEIKGSEILCSYTIKLSKPEGRECGQGCGAEHEPEWT